MSFLFNPLRSTASDATSSPQNEFSSITDSINRQLRSVANFLAPPPPERSESPPADPTSSPTATSQALVGIRNDLKEIGGSLKSGLNKIKYNFLNLTHNDFVEEGEDYIDVAGINEEVVKFVEEICSRPQCWTDFPLHLQNVFKMSEAQREHVLIMERIVPRLGKLRSEVGEYVGEGQFWMVYFIVLEPRLGEFDAQVLSTPQIVETRNLLLQKLKNKSKMGIESAGISNSLDTSLEDAKVSEVWKENISSGVGKVTQIENAMNWLKFDDEENTARWFEDAASTATSGDNQRNHESEGDVSFSDLEDEDNDHFLRTSASIQRAKGIRAPSPSGSSDWVQLNESAETQGQVDHQKARQSISRDKDSDGESTEWLKVGDSD